MKRIQEPLSKVFSRFRLQGCGFRGCLPRKEGLILKILVLDDEKLALEDITELIRQAEPTAEVIGFVCADSALEYISCNKVEIAFLDIDLGEGALCGIELAKKCKALYPKMNVIFVTGHSQYLLDAFRLHVSGYVMKPARLSDICAELKNLRNPLPNQTLERVWIQAFGHFEIFVDGRQLNFTRAKSKECLAYLVDRKGARVSYGNLSSILWEDKPFTPSLRNNTQKVISDMVATLKAAGVEDIIAKSRLGIAIVPGLVRCDYFEALNDERLHLSAATGEYMSNYSWSELTLGNITMKTISK